MKAGSWIDHYSTGVYHNYMYHQKPRRIEILVGWLHENIDILRPLGKINS